MQTGNEPLPPRSSLHMLGEQKRTVTSIYQVVKEDQILDTFRNPFIAQRYAEKVGGWVSKSLL